MYIHIVYLDVHIYAYIFIPLHKYTCKVLWGSPWPTLDSCCGAAIVLKLLQRHASCLKQKHHTVQHSTLLVWAFGLLFTYFI